MSNFSLKQLRHFLAVAQTESFTQASRVIHLSTPALFESIRQLESDLGTELFIRERHTVRLSPKGHQFIEHAQAVLNAARDAEHSLTTIDDSHSGEIVIGATASVTGYFLPRLLEPFNRLYPQVRVKIIEDRRDYLEHLLLNGELDIALLLGTSAEYATSFGSHTMLRSPWQVWLSLHHPLATEKNLQLSQLINERWILLKSDELGERLSTLQNLMFKKQPRLRTDWLEHCIRTESVEAVRSLVASGQGICILPNYLFRHWSLDGARLEARPIAQIGANEFADTVGLYWRQGAAISPYIKHLIRLAQH